MKKYIISILLMFIVLIAPAQNSGKGFSYQAVVRNSDGTPKSSQNIEIRFSLLLGANILPPAYQETQMTTSDEFGVFAVVIGKGIKSSTKAFIDINFSEAQYWLQVEVKDSGNWVVISNSQLLSVPYAEVAGNAQPVPIGSIIPFAGPKENIPVGWMLCNGNPISRAEFSELFKTIGTSWGTPDLGTFRIPDLRGLFLRGVDYDRGHDDDRNSRAASYPGGNTNQNVGSLQGESFRSHIHTGNTIGGPILQPPAEKYDDRYAGRNSFPGSTWYGFGREAVFPDGYPDEPYDRKLQINKEGGSETRPDNAYVNYIIKVK